MDEQKKDIQQHRGSARHLRERELAERWQTSRRTLQRWRAEGFGPAYILIGGAVRYRFADILDYEKRMRRGGDDV